MKRTNQFERTDRDITNALLQVMDQKSFEKITVQDILDEAMVNRSTFYQHFPDKYAILERLQERCINGMTERIDEIVQNGGAWNWDLKKVNEVLCEYLSKHQQQMRKILTVRSENLDMEEQMRLLLSGYLLRSGGTLTELEADMLSGMMVRFLIYFLDRGDMEANALSDQMLEIWLDMSLYFFRVDHVPDARQRILELIGTMHRE